MNYLVNDVMRFFAKDDGFYVSDNFHEVHCEPGLLWQIAAAGNSTLFQLFANVNGRANFGGGLMKIQKYETANLPIVRPGLLDARACKTVLSRAERLDHHFRLSVIHVTLDQTRSSRF